MKQSTGFDEERLRFDLIHYTGVELKKVSSLTTDKISNQLEKIDISSKSFSRVKDKISIIESATKEIDTTFKNVAKDANNNSLRVKKVNETMSELLVNFESVQGLIKTINSIADQTNLLALNATIEAARAGESGKGFAVVANEVKELSKTTKNANEDIQKTLENIKSSIENLHVQLSQTGDAISDSLENIEKSKENVVTINKNTFEFGQLIQSNIEQFMYLSDHANIMKSQVDELSTIADTFTFLLEMMKEQGLFNDDYNPLERLAPLVEQSEFYDSKRFNSFESEVVLSESDILISATDKRGLITFANEKFYEIAEYDYGSLINRPHNVIRHPDMPKAAFKDLWDVIKNGHLWQGIVKNKTKSGKYYWVKAMVFPCYKDHQIIGYISVRRKPSKEQVEQAVQAYRKLP